MKFFQLYTQIELEKEFEKKDYKSMALDMIYCT